MPPRDGQSAGSLLPGAPVPAPTPAPAHWQLAAGFGQKRPGISAGGGSGSIMELRGHAEGLETENQPDYFYVPIPNETPRKAEQEKLSGVVKNLHRKLRRKYREGEKPRCRRTALLGRSAPVGASRRSRLRPFKRTF